MYIHIYTYAYLYLYMYIYIYMYLTGKHVNMSRPTQLAHMVVQKKITDNLDGKETHQAKHTPECYLPPPPHTHAQTR